MALILADPPLVGRQQEFSRLHALLHSAIDGKGKTVFVSGEAGAGKTRLIMEFLNSLTKKKKTVTLKGWCLSNSTVPYFAFIEAFNAYFKAKQIDQKETTGFCSQEQAVSKSNGAIGSEEAKVKSWLTGSIQKEKSANTRNLSFEGWQNLTFSIVTEALLSIATRQPTILFIDDVQWADSSTLALIHYVSRAISSEKILLIAAFRTEELIPDAGGHPHPLLETLRLMGRENLFSEIKLPNLTQDDVRKMAEKMIGGTLNSDLSKKLAEESLGNPLFIVESLRMLSEQKNLFEEDGEWRLSIAELSTPPKIRDVILRRIGTLKSTQRRTLEAASVVGEKFDPEVLGEVLGLDNLEVLEMIYSISKATSLVVPENEHFRFDHAKSRDALYSELPASLKRIYHLRIAEKLERKSVNAMITVSSEIAFHYIQAGNKEKAVKFSLAAGESALARFSNPEAVKHFKYAAETLEGFPERKDEKLSALEKLGEAYFANSNMKEAEAIFLDLARSQTGTDRLRAYRKAIRAVFVRGDNPRRVLELGKEALPYAAIDRLESARIRFQTAGGLDMVKRKEEFDMALRVFEEEYSLSDIADAMVALCVLEVEWGSTEKGLAYAQRAIGLTRELGVRSPAILYAAYSFVCAGLFSEALELLRGSVQLGEKRGQYHSSAQALELMSILLEVQGRTEDALSQLLKAQEYHEKTDVNWAKDRFSASLMRLYAKLGNLTRAEEYLERLRILQAESKPSRGSAFFEISQAVFFAANNQWKEAYELLRRSPEDAKIWVFAALGQAIYRMNYAWIFNRHGRSEEASACLEKMRRSYEEVDERFAHVNIDSKLLTLRNVAVGEEFEVRLDLVNISRRNGTLINIEGLAPQESEVVNPPEEYSVENGFVDLKRKNIGPFELETIMVGLKALRPGSFCLNPQVTYIDELGETQTCRPNSVSITVEPARPKFDALPGRITTGFQEFDALLLGGVPERYAVTLASSSNDERELLIKKFLEAGAERAEATFYVTAEVASARALVDMYPSNLYLFLCNPQADAIIQNAHNVFKLRGVENLTAVDITLTKAFRALDLPSVSPRRICINIMSDVLLQHHVVNTRRWLSSLLPTLKARGFTILAVIDPGMHPAEETQAVLGLFDGEILIIEKETPKGTARFLKIKRMACQKYSSEEILLAEE